MRLFKLFQDRSYLWGILNIYLGDDKQYKEYLQFSYELVVPTFETKVTEYLCSGWVFFSSDKFRLFNQPFLTEFFYITQYVVLSLNLKIYITCDHFS